MLTDLLNLRFVISKVKNRVIERSYHGDHGEKVFYTPITFSFILT